jgi:hydroxymethylpyrimidine/phosphomethylpyrimidine kinase
LKLPRLLAIAGSDSSGGAGIQADIKTATAFGVYAMTTITAVTVQDTHGVYDIYQIPARIVRDQISFALRDIGADAIKIGMLGSAETVDAVAEILAHEAKDIPLVLDPVMAATGGTCFLGDDAIGIFKSKLIPLATLLTPNIPEAEQLSGIDIGGDDDAVEAAQRLRAIGAKAVLIKGGHALGDTVRDILVTQERADIFEMPRLVTGSTHGTGCTLATAIACGLAQGLTLSDAVRRARDFVQAAIAAAPGLGHGNGPLNHMHAIPRF